MDARDIIERSGIAPDVPDLDGDTYSTLALQQLAGSSGVPVWILSRTGIPPGLFARKLRDVEEKKLPKGYWLSPTFDAIKAQPRVLGDIKLGMHFISIKVLSWSLMRDEDVRFRAQKGN